jgi:hypothetical protein
LDRAVARMMVYRPLEWRGEVGCCCHCMLPSTAVMISLHDLGNGLSCRTLALTCCRKPERRRSVGWRQSGAVLG